MRVIIAGSRTILLPSWQVEKIVKDSGFNVTEVVSGEARGVDVSASNWATLSRIPITYFPAKWNENGNKAGPIRNRQMAEYADALILVWDGESRGAASMKREAEALGLPMHEVVVES